MRQAKLSIPVKQTGHIGNRPALVVLAVATVAVVAGAAAVLQPESYATGPGEWRTITLRDGSVARLGPKTRIVVRYATAQRSIEQVRCEGEATYQVAHDPARAFSVECDATTVRAIGTKFGVARHAEQTKVTVAKGTVAVSRRPIERDQSTSQDEVRADVGHQVIVDASSPLTARPVDADDELLWEHARVFFRGVPVEEAIGEYNRRHASQIPIPNYTGNSFRVFGKFQLDDPAQFVRFIDQNLAQQRARPK